MPNKCGRPEHAPDRKSRKFVEEMSAAGVPHEAIADVIEVSVKTLRKHYRAELDTATARLIHKVGARLIARAMGDDAAAVSALIFILRARGGWNDRPAAPGAAQPASVPLDAIDTWGGEAGTT